MSAGRTPLLAAAADVVAVVVFAAAGRLSHGDSGDVLGLLGTVAPFAVGLGVAWAIPAVRSEPVSTRAGGLVLAGTAGVGLLLRAAFTGRLPVSFAVVTVGSLAVLLLGWRMLSAVVGRRLTHR